MLDSTMVKSDIDKLTKDFNTTLDTIQGSITGYVLTLAIAVPVSGWLMNKFNGKKIFVGKHTYKLAINPRPSRLCLNTYCIFVGKKAIDNAILQV